MSVSQRFYETAFAPALHYHEGLLAGSGSIGDEHWQMSEEQAQWVK